MSEQPDPTPAAPARRLAAELELARAVHSLTIHELGNPLQSLLVLLELSRDDLREAGVEGRPVDRLDRALESIERLRRILLRSTGVRASLADDGRAPDWGSLLDELGGFVGERLSSLRATLVRFSDEIDPRSVAPASVRAATLALLVGACNLVRDARSDGMTVELHGRVLDERACLRVAVRGPEGPVALGEGLADTLDDLLAAEPDARCQRDGPALVLWSA